MAYLTLSEHRIRSSYTAPEWDAFVLATDSELGEAPGTAAKFLAWVEEAEGTIDDALRRRYKVPFAAPVPRTVKRWMRHLLDEQFEFYRRVPGSTEAQDEGVLGLAKLAREEMAKAANDNEPHPELPLRADLPESSGNTKGAPIVFELGATVHDVWRTLGGQ